VLFGKWSGTEVKIESVEYLIMNESDIMRRARRPPEFPRRRPETSAAGRSWKDDGNVRFR